MHIPRLLQTVSDRVPRTAGRSHHFPPMRLVSPTLRCWLLRYGGSPWVQAALVVIVALATLSRFTNAYWTSYHVDSFTMQYDSVRVLHGEVPYRDFFNFPTPGTFWLQALVFGLFGMKAINATYLLIGTLAVLGVALYLISYALTGRRLVSWFAPLFVLWGLAPHFPFPYHHWYGITMSSLTVLAMTWWLRAGGWWRLGIAGAASILTGFFVQTQGVMLILAIGAFLVLKTAMEEDTPRRLATMLGMRLLIFGAGVVLAALPVLLYFAVVGGLHQLIYDTITWPQHQYAANNNVPFLEDINLWIFWRFDNQLLVTSIPMTKEPMRFYTGMAVTLTTIIVPCVVVLFSARLLLDRLSAIVRHWWRGDEALVERTGAAAADLLLLCGLINVAFAAALILGKNMDLLHVVWLTILAYPALVGFIFVATRAEGGDRAIAARPFGPGIQGLNFLLAFLVIASGVWYWLVSPMATKMTIDDLVSALPVPTYVRVHTTSDDRIAVFTYGGPTYFYSRPAAIGYTLLSPGSGLHTPAQFKEAALQVRQNLPRMVIFEPHFDWETFFGSNDTMIQWARQHYGDAQGNPSDRVKAPEGDYLVYMLRSP